jgi:hypothetical protein
MRDLLRRLWLRPAACWTVIALLVAAFAWRDAGRGWDDGVEQEYGRAVWDYFASGGETWRPPAVDGGVMKYYGPLGSFVAAAWHKVWGLPEHAQRPWVISWFWIAAFAPTVWLAVRVAGGVAAGWLAGLALIALPRMFGEAFVNAKDLPLACTFAWCLWTACRLATTERVGLGAYALAGAAAAAALASRTAALFAFGPLFAVVAWRVARALWPERRWAEAGRDVAGVAMAAGIAFASVSLVWPTVWEEGPGVWLEAARLAKAFSMSYPVLYLGETIQSDALPWHYPFVYLAITTPLPALVLFGVGIGVLAAKGAGLWREWRGGRGIEALVTLLFVAFPFGVFLVARPNIYDGIRHFLFLVPLVAVAAAAGGAWLIERAGAKRAGALLVVAALAYGVVPIARMYPFSLAYFNPLAGPARTLHTRFETDYWVLSYREAAEWINARQSETERPLRVIVAANVLSLPAFKTFVDGRVEVFGMEAITTNAALPEGVDYYVSTVRYGWARRFPASPVVERVGRGGILFSVIREGALARANEARRDEAAAASAGAWRSEPPEGKAAQEAALGALRGGDVGGAILGLDAHLLVFPEDRAARVLLAEILRAVGVGDAAAQQARLAGAGLAAEEPVAKRAAAVMAGP